MGDRQASVSAGHQVRLMLWGPPRSVTTVFTKFMSHVEDSLIYFQPYLGALWFGPDSRQYPEHCAHARPYMQDLSKATSVTDGIEASECTFSWAKEQLEKPHCGKKLIFCKDLCFSIADHYEFLPAGYRHVFLLRHPLKVFTSWRKIYPLERDEDFQLDEAPPLFFPSGFAFKEMSELLDHVKMTHDPEPIIIDSDDMLNDPHGILSELFKKVGLPFEEKHLQWEEGGAVSKQWVTCKAFLQGHKLRQYYKSAFASTCFTTPSALPDRSTLTADVLRLADASMPYYDKMFAQRLTLQNVE